MLQEECCASKNKTQTRWLEERKIYYASRPASGSLPKMAPAPQLKAVGFLCLRMQKQTSEKDKSKHGS
jgi:hypothetical protein